MNRYAHRSRQTELIDEAGVPADAWRVCLGELNRINAHLGGHAITLLGLKALIDPARTEITVAEIGCGGGDNLKAIYHWNKSRGLPLRYIGIDLSKSCVDYASSSCRDLGARFIHADYREVFFEDQPDIVFCSLFCHHFTNEELVDMLRWLHTNSRSGFFINDLQRHPVAFYSIRALTALFSRSYLIKNDAPISVLRGFRRQELEALLHQADIPRYSLSWRWAFRYLLIVKK